MALELAGPGIFLAITGRDKARLDGVADACKMKGAAVGAFQIDAANFAAMAGLIAEIEAEVPLDLVIANAGVSAGSGGGDETDEQIAEILAANVDGVISTVRPALAAMAPRKSGPDRDHVVAGEFPGLRRCADLLRVESLRARVGRSLARRLAPARFEDQRDLPRLRALAHDRQEQFSRCRS